MLRARGHKPGLHGASPMSPTVGKTARIIHGLKPEVVISGNTPTEAQRAIIKTCKLSDARFVVLGPGRLQHGGSKLMTKKLGVVGMAIGWYYQRLDRSQFRASDAIVVISEDFVPLVSSWSGDDAKISVIENWAAIDDIPVGSKDNAWAHEHDLCNGFSFLYSGTLGRKHKPMLLARLAERSDQVIVVAQGYGIPHLQAAKVDHRLHSLKLLPIQPAKHLADVLATADVLVATIEPDAGAFAVPSKVLSYLFFRWPILLAAPKENLAARIVERCNAGFVVDPSDEAGFMVAANRLRDDPQLRATLGANGRAYAERAFDMKRITDKFEDVLLCQRV